MVTFIAPGLLDKGIALVGMELDLDTSKISNSVKETLARYEYNPDVAQPFTVSLNAFDRNDKPIAVLGFAEGVLHKKPLLLDDAFKYCRQVLYLHMLYIEKEYEKCGVATNVLDYLPKLIDTEMVATIDAVVLAPVPQYKGPDGQIVQLPLGIEFLVNYRKLVNFYSKRNFHFCQSFLLMGRMVA